MKKVLVLLLMAVVLFSCKKKNDDGGSAATDPLVGNWVIDEIDLTGNTNLGGTTINFTGEGQNMTGGYDVKADGTMTYDVSYDLVLNLTPLPPQTIPVTQSGSGTWKKENNNLIINDQNGTTVYPIKVVTADILILDQDTTINQGGVMADLELEITLRK